MSDVPRLSHMIGLEHNRPGREAAWPTNIALVCLGGAILWIAFRFLKWDDPRLIYNPWTYTVITPVALISLSLLLRQLVSRVVERSAQVAFLFSVMVHLLLLVWALDVVIYKSRMWPNFFDALAKERDHLLGRENTPPKYFNLPLSTSTTGKRPDYLRYVPTEHAATETELSDVTRMQLAQSERSDIASPDPKLQPTVEPVLLERQEPEQAMAVKMEAPAELSRSELAKPTASRAESIDVALVQSSAPALTAADVESTRSRSGDTALPPSANNPLEPASFGPSSPPLGAPQSIARNTFEPTLAAAAAASPRETVDYLHSSFAARAPSVPVPEAGGGRATAAITLAPSGGVSDMRPRNSDAGRSELHALEPAFTSGGAAGAGLGNIARSDQFASRGSLPGEKDGAGIDRGSFSLPRGELGSIVGPAGSGRIDVPQSQSLGSAVTGNDQLGVAPSAQAGGRRTGGGADGGQLRLDVDAQLGLGGISPRVGSGPLIARSSPSLEDFSLPALDLGRFSHDAGGGLLAGGVAGAVPTPAFQQRIDRLKEDEGGDSGPSGPQTEQAIERGLEFLAKHQRPDGSWRLQDLDRDVLIRSDTAATGLCVLAFQGAGYTHKQYKYAAVNDKALKFLVQHQRPNGDLYIPQDPASDQNAWLYSHGIATLALCEAYGMTQDPELRTAAQAAVNFMVNSQDPQRGGWRYRPGVGSDTSVTGWFMMALKSAQLARLNVPNTAFERMARYVQASQLSAAQPHLFRYNPFAPDTPEQRHGLKPTHVMTSVGLLMRLYLGWRRELPEMQAGADYLLSYPPSAGTPEATQRDTYYWYYATQVLFHMGGERWQRWNDRLRPLLLDAQIIEGELAGSWDPYLPSADLWARYGGRLYVTTLNLLSLEVHYRHLPLYEATAR